MSLTGKNKCRLTPPHRDEAAFEVLLWRHGPKVLGICRHVLRHDQDAEDAFQATFLVLVRKAASIGKRQAIGPWLSRVAFRVALRAKAQADKRVARETSSPDLTAVVSSPDLVWRDLQGVLNEEVDKLPEKYRTPFILCYMDGKTNEEAAQELGCPKGTVLSRLAWARERLRARLTRRGLPLSAPFLATALATNAAAAVTPAALLKLTLKTALLVVAGKAIGKVASGQVVALTKGAWQTMLWTKFKIAAACVLVIGALGAGGVLALQSGGARPNSGHSARVAEGKAEPADKADKPKSDKVPKKPDTPKTEEKLYELAMKDQPWAKVFEWYADISGLPFVGTSKPTGAFTYIPPKGKGKLSLVQITDALNEALMAKKYVLVRRTASFTVLPADETIDVTLVPRVRLEDLDKRGKTELVLVVMTLASQNAKDLAPDVRKIMSPFGQATVLNTPNLLVLLDTAGNLRHVCQMIKDIEARDAEKKRKTREK